jgi:hypothetical protein
VNRCIPDSDAGTAGSDGDERTTTAARNLDTTPSPSRLG